MDDLTNSHNNNPLAPAQAQPVPSIPPKSLPVPVSEIPKTLPPLTPVIPVELPQVQPTVTLPEIKKPAGPKLFGYRPPNWATDYNYVKTNKGKGKDSESNTWLLLLIDRVLKVHSK